ncbi:MAG: methylmalonyl-CoA epimerase [Geovibrio sp.]|jgi:methylmalonyl-CoA/ethylmalonyl-CoA epimerase|uniref:methylmalonyl-CoA epimerase n=1 Tax=Geovibrio ferrireducens TaxID=46201 RepID=UPI00224839FD|nr:methylmalonyl-CoA epimerase [Geovibrio ferrireducens]MCD8491644.1 methylmalonyl-CoA epimerase [Geovibrio sp.]MCD8566960.1 methylmalonyl-CoA epimerase [Geovibrio sp.]
MLEKIDHIGIAVRNLDEALKFYGVMGAGADHFEEVPTQKVRVAFINVGGVNIELLEPTSEESPIAKYLEKKGEGIHHIAYRVPCVKTALDKLRSEGIKLIDEEPKPGAHGMQIAFVHPKSVNGVLTELSQEGAH